jgi:hypothetical protein
LNKIFAYIYDSILIFSNNPKALEDVDIDSMVKSFNERDKQSKISQNITDNLRLISKLFIRVYNDVIDDIREKPNEKNKLLDYYSEYYNNVLYGITKIMEVLEIINNSDRIKKEKYLV